MPDPASALYAGIDIGGTNQTVAVGDAAATVLATRRLQTPPGATAPALVRRVGAALDECVREVAGRTLRRIGIGFGGPVDFARGAILTSHHVSEWSGYPLLSELAQRFGVPVVLDNDANAGALAEARLGAGRAHRDLIYLNVGTGIGAGIVLDGRVYRGADGLAGEIGHVTVESSPDARRCTCGKLGCLEAYASGRAIGGPAVTDAARAGDVAAQRRLDGAAHYMALALGAAVNTLNPAAVVIGGGVSEAGDLLLAPLRHGLAGQVMPGMPVPAVLRAELGYDAGVIGALLLATER